MSVKKPRSDLGTSISGKRSEGPQYSTQLLESSVCGCCGLLWSVIAVLVFIAVIGVVLILLPDSFNRKNESMWKCEDKNAVNFDEETCIGTDLTDLENSAIIPFISSSPDIKNAQRFMSLYIVPKRKSGLYALNFAVGAEYNVSFINKKKTVDKVESFKREIRINCYHRRVDCDPVEIYYGEIYLYNVSFKFYSDAEYIKEHFKNAISDITFRWVYGNPNFSWYQLGMRYGHMGISIILLVIYIVNICMNPLLKTVEQKWLIIYVICAIIYDNPLYAFQIGFSNFVLSTFDAFFQALFQAFAIFYTLVLLGGFITRKTTFLFFTLPRFLLSLVFLILDALFLITSLSIPIVAEALRDPLYANSFNIATTVVFIIYILWFLYTVIRVVVISKQHPKALKGRYRFFAFFIIFMILFFLGVMFAGPMTVIRVQDFLGVWAHTIVDTFGWILMIWLCPTRRQRVTSTSLNSALRPKEKAAESEKERDKGRASKNRSGELSDVKFEDE